MARPRRGTWSHAVHGAAYGTACGTVSVTVACGRAAMRAARTRDADGPGRGPAVPGAVWRAGAQRRSQRLSSSGPLNITSPSCSVTNVRQKCTVAGSASGTAHAPDGAPCGARAARHARRGSRAGARVRWLEEGPIPGMPPRRAARVPHVRRARARFQAISIIYKA